MYGKNEKFEGTDQMQEAFKMVKKTNEAMLAYLDFSKPLEIYTDLSDYQLLGGIVGHDGKLTAFFSIRI